MGLQDGDPIEIQAAQDEISVSFLIGDEPIKSIVIRSGGDAVVIPLSKTADLIQAIRALDIEAQKLPPDPR